HVSWLPSPRPGRPSFGRIFHSWGFRQSGALARANRALLGPSIDNVVNLRSQRKPAIMSTIQQKQLTSRGSMSMTRLFGAVVLAVTTSAAFAQVLPSQSVRPAYASGGADQTSVPKLEHFDPDLVDKTLDPCNDFYKYSCNKWVGANPIPADQVYWSTGSGLQ